MPDARRHSSAKGKAGSETRATGCQSKAGKAMSLRFSSVAAMPDAIRNKVEAQGKGAPREPTTRTSKYGNKPTKVDGIQFPSKKEASYYAELKIRQAAGEVSYFLMQVPVRLPDGTKYIVDFQVFFTDPARPVEYIDTKGKETPVFKMKKRGVEHFYPIKITVV
jgi:hypothetical protein